MSDKNHSSGNREDGLDDLELAFKAAMAFSISQAATFEVSDETLEEQAKREAAFNKIMIDDLALSSGTRLNIIEHARSAIANWKQVRSDFDRRIEPAMKDIKAAEALEAELITLAQNRQKDIDHEEEQVNQDERYRYISKVFAEAEERLRITKAHHGNRDANVLAYRPIYFVFLVSIGFAEWFINYDTLFLFLGVPAIAAGTTAILGLALAFAAHGHGTILKQWAFRFGRDRDRSSRQSDWRFFGLSTFALIIVLMMAGGSRYAAALHVMQNQAGPNLLGSDAMIDVSPMRDVLISLLANIGAWVVGVFIAYSMHDIDPDHMENTHKFNNARRKYQKWRRDPDDRIKTIDARFAKDRANKELEALARRNGVERESRMRQQVNSHEEAIVRAIATSTQRLAERYREILSHILQTAGAEFSITQGEGHQPLTLHEYRAKKILIDADLVREMA